MGPGTPAHPLEAPMQTLESPPSDSPPKPVHSDMLLMSPKLKKTSLRRPSKRKMRASEMKKKSLTSREPMMAGQRMPPRPSTKPRMSRRMLLTLPMMPSLMLKKRSPRSSRSSSPPPASSGTSHSLPRPTPVNVASEAETPSRPTPSTLPLMTKM